MHFWYGHYWPEDQGYCLFILFSVHLRDCRLVWYSFIRLYATDAFRCTRWSSFRELIVIHLVQTRLARQSRYSLYGILSVQLLFMGQFHPPLCYTTTSSSRCAQWSSFRNLHGHPFGMTDGQSRQSLLYALCAAAVLPGTISSAIMPQQAVLAVYSYQVSWDLLSSVLILARLTRQSRYILLYAVCAAAVQSGTISSAIMQQDFLVVVHTTIVPRSLYMCFDKRMTEQTTETEFNILCKSAATAGCPVSSSIMQQAGQVVMKNFWEFRLHVETHKRFKTRVIY